MNWIRTGITCGILLFCLNSFAQQNVYPQNYFRSPLNIPMELVANFGEIRTNHWHMGLDIRTQQRVNLPVYAAADGYIARVSVEPFGFGQAIYINHPNGYTTVYGHLNAFFPALAQYVEAQQYKNESWETDLTLPPNLFPVKKGDFIARSGSTGGSQGPHVHFEIRDTKTGKCLNELLFNFPIPDAAPPNVTRVALYDRNESVYEQTPRLFALHKAGSVYKTASDIKTGSDKISFAISATDHFSHTTNPNGIYAASLFLDGQPVSGFVLDNIDYSETRYINAQVDYHYKHSGGPNVQHLSPMPGDTTDIYQTETPNGLIFLRDENPHQVKIEVKDANLNTTTVEFTVQYDASLSKPFENNNDDKLVPQNVNVFENAGFELSTSEYCIYDTVPVTFSSKGMVPAAAISPLFTFCSAAIPAHDSVRVRILPTENVPAEDNDHVIIKSVAGTRTEVQKATWQGRWLAAKFRQFGTYQAFVDNVPPTVNSPASDLSRASRIVFIPHDNFDEIKNFRAELDGRWLCFSNDKGHAWIYHFDEHFPRGEHQLKVIVEDEAGNVSTRVWNVKR